MLCGHLQAMFPLPTMMISAVVTHHAANYLAAGKRITEDSIGCGAHLLQLVVDDVCGKHQPDLDKLLKSVSSERGETSPSSVQCIHQVDL